MQAGDSLHPECIHLIPDQTIVQVPKPKAKAEKVEDKAPEEPEQATEHGPEDAEEIAASVRAGQRMPRVLLEWSWI